MDLASRITGVMSTDVLYDQPWPKLSEWLGARYFALSHHVDFVAAPKALRIHNYPPGWEAWYDERSLGLSDPIHRASHRMASGFFWNDVADIIQINGADRQVLGLGKQIGLGDGVTVPVNVPGEARGSCSFVAESGAKLPRGTLLLAQSIGALAFDRMRWLQRRASADPLPRLSKRQRQCIALAGQGLSNREIALRLGIGVQSVMEHLREARAKLGVGSRCELVVGMLRIGDLCFDDMPPRAACG